MTLYNSLPRNSSRASHPFDPDQCRRADFARQAVIAAFGRHARAIDQGSFADHPPIRRKPAVDDATWARRVAHALKSQLKLESTK